MMARLLAMLLVLSLTAPAQASVIYQFTTTSYSWTTPQFGDPSTLFRGISIRLGFAEAAWRTDAIQVDSVGPAVRSFVATEPTGFADEAFHDGLTADTEARFDLDLVFDAAGVMTGTMRLSWNALENEVVLAAQPDGSWAGGFGSDYDGLGCYDGRCPLTGTWQLVSAPGDTGGPARVPGPSPLLLIGFGLLATFAVRRIEHGGMK